MARQDRNPYEVLGLDADATSREIKAAYRRLAMKHHPDKNPGDKASEWIFREVNRAYENLQGISRGNRSSGQYEAPHERQERERAARDGGEDERTREQARRERKAHEDRRRREQFVEESERRWARAERERKRQEQEHEAEETLRKHWKQFWLVVMPLFATVLYRLRR